MTRTKKFMYNTISTAIYQVVVMIVGIITPRILLSVYGSNINGLVSSITQFITYFSLVEAGIAGAAVYALYKPLANNNHKEINSIVSASKKFYIQAGYIFTILVICLAIIYPFFVKTQELSFIMIAILVVVLGAKGFLEFFTLAKYRVLLTADQKTYIVSNASTIYIIVQMIIVVFLAKLNCNVVIVYALSIIALMVRSFILMIYVKRKYKYINYNEIPNTAALDKRWDALFLQILQAVQTGAPVIIATIFTSLKMVSIYSVFNMVLTGINGILGIFVNGLSASFGDIISRKEKGTLQKSYLDFEWVYYMIIAIVYAISMLTIMPFINIYTSGITDANYNQPLIGFLFVLNGLLGNIKTPQGMLVISAGLYKETRYRTLTQALIIVIVGVVLAPLYGIIGILIASCLSNLYRDIDLIMFIPKYVTKLKVFNTVKRVILILMIMLIIIIPIYNLNMYNNINGYIDWIKYVFIVGIYSFIVTIIVGFVFEKNQMICIIKRIKNMVVKK